VFVSKDLNILFILDILQQKMAKSTGVLIGTDLNYVQFNSQIANSMQDEITSINSKKEISDFNMPIDGNEQGIFYNNKTKISIFLFI
jgi:hypothetical protein